MATGDSVDLSGSVTTLERLEFLEKGMQRLENENNGLKIKLTDTERKFGDYKSEEGKERREKMVQFKKSAVAFVAVAVSAVALIGGIIGGINWIIQVGLEYGARTKVQNLMAEKLQAEKESEELKQAVLRVPVTVEGLVNYRGCSVGKIFEDCNVAQLKIHKQLIYVHADKAVMGYFRYLKALDKYNSPCLRENFFKHKIYWEEFVRDGFLNKIDVVGKK